MNICKCGHNVLFEGRGLKLGQTSLDMQVVVDTTSSSEDVD